MSLTHSSICKPLYFLAVLMMRIICTDNTFVNRSYTPNTKLDRTHTTHTADGRNQIPFIETAHRSPIDKRKKQPYKYIEQAKTPYRAVQRAYRRRNRRRMLSGSGCFIMFRLSYHRPAYPDAAGSVWEYQCRPDSRSHAEIPISRKNRLCKIALYAYP